MSRASAEVLRQFGTFHHIHCRDRFNNTVLNPPVASFAQQWRIWSILINLGPAEKNSVEDSLSIKKQKLFTSPADCYFRTKSHYKLKV